ncbi:GNAT family N-acetyltransferase [Lignipirellula cremea]|uniref:GNAT family N-acetyltransferase n=1 Tax=Lignipirellula cremea TaxID=2528010 RepID=UPI0018D24F9E|nr:GNAT family N-acetyltransferase [Lignipirellula cremea]
MPPLRFMHIDLITDDASLAGLAGEWDSLTRDVPFRSFAWLSTWWKHYHEGELFVLAVRDEQNTLIGLAPWRRSRHAGRGKVLQFLGSGEVCSDYLSLLTTSDTAEAATTAVASWLTRNNREWDVLELAGVSTSDCVAAKLVGNLVDNGNAVNRKEADNCWRIELPDNWDDYLAALSKSHRKQIRRLWKNAFESGRAQLHTASSPEELQRGMEILVDQHQRRRRSLGEPGCFASKAFSGFLHEAAERMFPTGQIELHWVEVEGRPVTAEIHLSGGGVSYAYQSGVDPDYLHEESGRLIMIATIRRAMEQGRRAFDFCRGDEPYKAHFRAEPRPSVDLRIAADSTSSQLRHGVWLAGDTVKSLVKAGLNLTGMH